MQIISKLVNVESTARRCIPSAFRCSSFAGENASCNLDMGSLRLCLYTFSLGGAGLSSCRVSKVGRMFCTVPNNVASPAQENQGTATPQQPSVQPPQQPSVQPPQQRSLFADMDTDSYQMSPTVRRRPYNLEAKMRMKQYRREAMMQRRQQELEEEQRTFQLDYTTIYQKGHPGTVQGVIKEIIHLGYIVTLPNGREGLLAASHLGCSGGIPLLERLFKVGQEITIRVIPVPNPAGKDRVYVRP